jgi:hypothetical protein
MKPLKNFKEFITERITKKQMPDLSRAKFLISKSEKTYSFIKTLLKEITLTDNNANSIIKLSMMR